MSNLSNNNIQDFYVELVRLRGTDSTLTLDELTTIIKTDQIEYKAFGISEQAALATAKRVFRLGNVLPLTAGVNDLELRKSTPPTHFTVKGSNLYNVSSNSSRTFLYVIMLPVEFSAARIGLRFLGGSGDMTDMKAIVASTDDIGDLLYQNTAETKKFVVPQRDGSTYNDRSFLGWKDVTFDGASSTSITDVGSGNDVVVWSDIVDVQAVSLADDPEGTFDGYYPLMLRVHGTGIFTVSGSNDGQTSQEYFDSSGARIHLNAERSGDGVTTPTQWGVANTPSFRSSNTLAVVVEAYTQEQNRSFMMVGDSRFATASTIESSVGYKVTAWRVERDLVAAGIKASVINTAKGGNTSDEYYARAKAMLDSDVIKPTDAVYLIYSINDGLPTDQIIANAKANCLRFLETCATKGIKPVLVTSFPRPSNYTTAELALLEGVETFATQTGFKTVSPLKLFGDANGVWLTGINEDSSHMTPEGYDQLAAAIVEKLV
jgi:lysophospholipase L1-like esterase